MIFHHYLWLRPLQWWAESAPLGKDRVKVSENLGATSVAPVAPRGYIPVWPHVPQRRCRN